MSEAGLPAVEAAVVDHGTRFDPRKAFQSVAISILVSGVCPFILYKFLVPHYPNGSVMPLLWASGFPVLGLLASYLQTRAIDFIAVIALFSISYSVVATVIAGEIRLAMILGATQGFVIAAIFGISALIRRPVLFYITRQFVAGNDTAARERFNAVSHADGGRTFSIATAVWVMGIILMGIASIALAILLAPPTYLLLNNIINTAVNIVLVVWTIRFIRPRLTRVAERVFGDTAVQAAG